MRRILLMGSSHCAILYLAKEKFEDGEEAEIDWLVAPGNFEFIIDKETSRVSLPEHYFETPHAKNLKIIKQRGDSKVVYLNDYDMIYYSSIGLRPVGAQTDHPAHMLNRQPVSESLLRAMIRHDINMQSHFKTISGMRYADYSGKIYCMNWIRPNELPRKISFEQWKRFCIAEMEVIADFLVSYDASMVGHLTGQEYLTDEALVLDPNVAATHGNCDYAQQIADKAKAL